MQIRPALCIIELLIFHRKGEILLKKVSTLRRAVQVYRAYWKEGALCVLFQLVLRLMAFVPLLFLAAKETKPLALLCIPLYILIVLPARQNMALAMQSAFGGGPLFGMQLVSMQNYWGKVARGLKRAGLLMLWGGLWIAATVLAVVVYTGETDVFTVLRAVMTLGGGSTVQGIKVLLMIYAATLLPLVIGVAFHSGARHAEACGDATLVRGHRLGVVLWWLAGLLALVPFLAATVAVSADYVSALSAALSGALNSFGKGGLALPPLDQKAYLIGGAVVLLLLPLLPLKQLLPAAYLRGLKENQ